MPGLLGKKIGMTSVFSADGKNVPCTVIEAGPCVVTQVKTIEKDAFLKCPCCGLDVCFSLASPKPN